MINKEVNGFVARTFPILLAFLAFTIPIHYRFSLYVQGIALVLSVYLLIKTDRYRYFFKKRLAIGVIAFWCTYLFSLVYSSNIQYGLNDVFQKITMVVLPLIFIPYKGNNQSSKLIKKFFLMGLLLSSLFFVFRAFENSILLTPAGVFFKPNPVGVPWENYFFYERFVFPHHPTYYSMYLALGIVLISERIKQLDAIKPKSVHYIFWFYLLIITYLTSSKVGIIVSVVISFLALMWVLKRKGKIILSIFFGCFFVLAAVLVLSNERIDSSLRSINKYFKGEKVDDPIAKQGLVRFEIWRTIPDIFEENSILFGTGIGDANGVLVNAYIKNGVEYAQELRLNMHNQYFQTLVSVGLFGLIILLAILGYAFWIAIKNRDMILFLFLIIISVNFMFESVFERVFGIIFFAFFLLFLSSRDEVKMTETRNLQSS